ncbi:MAG: SDR family NAD(P)-dependent oxidoreductase [Dethiobacteria bacterium]|jgi:2-deoxy-D-gluconate 3-dehydrogenase|nr:glucose 1-dehydrogenase [Bacillota bacterium]
MELFSLEGKNAVVVGASRGIGKSLALTLARAGANIIPVSRSPEKIKQTALEAEAFGVKAQAIPADVTIKEEVEKLKEEALSALGKVDILVNCQGINIKKWALELSPEEWKQVIDINLNSVFMTCKAFGSSMVEQRYGKIINIASMTSYVGIHRSSAYSASKGGIVQLSQVLAMEWAPYNINVNCIAPGFFRTEITRPVFSDKEAYNRIIARTPMKRVGEVEDLSGTLLYLASSASDYVTGITIPVDGGFLAYGI